MFHLKGKNVSPKKYAYENDVDQVLPKANSKGG